MSKYIPVDMPRIWRVTVQSGSKMKSAREEVGAFLGRTSAKSPRGERKRERKREERGKPGGRGAKRKRRGREDGERRERGEEDEGPRGEGFSRGCRSVGVASASSRVRLTSDLLLKRFHSFPSSPSFVPLGQAELSPYERASLACRC